MVQTASKQNVFLSADERAAVQVMHWTQAKRNITIAESNYQNLNKSARETLENPDASHQTVLKSEGADIHKLMWEVLFQ